MNYFTAKEEHLQTLRVLGVVRDDVVVERLLLVWMLRAQ